VAALPGLTSLPGDVDESGAVDVADAVLALRFIIKLYTPTPRQARAADVYPDGQITVQDAVQILTGVVGLPGYVTERLVR
jgi:hypothetical protein